jgi:hypothetical protein
MEVEAIAVNFFGITRNEEFESLVPPPSPKP